MKKRLIVLLGLMVFVGLVTSSCYNLGRKIVIEKEIAFDPMVDSIVVDSSVGDVFVVPEDRDTVFVSFETYENGLQLSVLEGAQIRIRTELNYRIFNTRGYESYRLVVRVPEDYAEMMRVEITSGDLELNGFELDELVLKMTSGDMNVWDVDADEIRLDMTSGDMGLTDVTCDEMYIDLTSGNVELDGFRGALAGESTSGDVDVHYAGEMDDFRYSMTSGKIELDYSDVDEVDAVFDVHATSGDIRMDMSLDEVMKLDDDVVEAQVGDGRYEVRVDMTSGNVVIWD